MKRKLSIICLLLALVITMSGCGNAKNIKPRPSDEELAKASTVCGVVREVNGDTIKVQLCGNKFEGVTGYCYIDVENEYDIAEGNSVLLYYTGKIEFKEKDTYIEANNIEVCYMEPYENDGMFSANLLVSGMVTEETDYENSLGESQSVSFIHIKSLEDEPEWDFSVKFINNGENEIVIDLDTEWLSITDEVTVTYDTDTMEVISITQ